METDFATPLPAPELAAAPTRFDERRQALLAAAAQRYNELGVRGATLAVIAGDVGLGTSSVTYYYRRKEDLAAACFEQAIALHDDLVGRVLLAKPRWARWYTACRCQRCDAGSGG